LSFNITARELNGEGGDKVFVSVFIRIHHYIPSSKIGEFSISCLKIIFDVFSYYNFYTFLMEIFMLSSWFSLKIFGGCFTI
jgi:hypothetical protein